MSRRWRMPRRLRFHRAGWIFSVGTIFLGMAAIGTGNNLLFLLLGAMLGFIALSGWLSEQVLRRVEVRRRLPQGATAGRPARISYELENRKRRLPSFALEVGEDGYRGGAFAASVAARGRTVVRVEETWEQRGVYPLTTVVLSTSFPFGLFQKERDVELPGEVIVWPRTDRPVREPRVAGERARRSGPVQAGAAGARGEYRGLRPYRTGDDPRDVHWRSSARAGGPVVREYERDQSQALWLCLDLCAHPGAGAEVAVEIAAALAAGAIQRGEPVGLLTADCHLAPGGGGAQLERILDELARAHFRTGAPRLAPPVPPRECALVTTAPGGDAGWGDVFLAERGGR
ncbi:DUF58 domain-containing protein [soil metagenome]